MTEPEKLPERYYRDLLAKQVGGRIEVRLPFGRADVVTDTHIYEVEPIAGWRHGAAQALQYASQVPQSGALALYGDPWRLREVFAELQRLPGPGLELWWLASDEFVFIANADDASRHMPVRPVPAVRVAGTLKADAQAPQGRAQSLATITSLAAVLDQLIQQVHSLVPMHMLALDRVDELERRLNALTGEAPQGDGGLPAGVTATTALKLEAAAERLGLVRGAMLKPATSTPGSGGTADVEAILRGDG